jgi:hypothetical protein
MFRAIISVVLRGLRPQRIFSFEPKTQTPIQDSKECCSRSQMYMSESRREQVEHFPRSKAAVHRERDKNLFAQVFVATPTRLRRLFLGPAWSFLRVANYGVEAGNPQGKAICEILTDGAYLSGRTAGTSFVVGRLMCRESERFPSSRSKPTRRTMNLFVCSYMRSGCISCPYDWGATPSCSRLYKLCAFGRSDPEDGYDVVGGRCDL